MGIKMKYSTAILKDGHIVVYMEDKTLSEKVQIIFKDSIIPFNCREEALSYIKRNNNEPMGNLLYN